MLNYLWPVALIVLSNTVYQICAKSVPLDMHPLASLTVVYLVGALLSCILYHVMQRGSIVREFSHLNWASLVLGIAIVGLELGNIMAFRAGWQVSVLSTVQSAFLAVCLIGVGAVLFQEPITATKVVGVAICLIGLWVINS